MVMGMTMLKKPSFVSKIMLGILDTNVTKKIDVFICRIYAFCCV